MAEIICQPKELIAAFVNVRQGHKPETPWGNYTAIGLMRSGRLVAGVIYNGFEAANVNMHIGAAEGCMWLTPAFLQAAFEYPFNQLGKRRVSAFIRSKNEQALRFVEKLGFTLEGRFRNLYPDDDMICYGLLREECRVLMKKAA